MAELSGVEALQSEIEKSKDKLRGYNENIKKLTGRDPSRPRVRRFLSGEGGEREDDGFPGRASRGRGRLFGLARRSIMEDSGPPAKRRIVGGAFSRLGPAPVPARRKEREDSPYEEELPHKLSVHSSVVATSREAKNRKEILQEQTKDKEGMQRNRRMFGLLLGTLNKFKTESKTLETKEVQRKKIEEKLEENAEKEKRKFKMETKLLMEEMHLEQSKISRLQQKMEMVQEHAEREEEMKKLKNFIVTKTKPRIFWRPRQMPAMLENKLKESKKVVDGMLQEGQDRLEKEIKELMERENKREERIKMRLREDGLLEDGEGEGGEGADEENKDDGNGIRANTGRTVVEVKVENDRENSGSDRLFRRGDKGSDDEEMGRDSDVSKKTRRTVIVEHERDQSGSESDEAPGTGSNAPDVTDRLGSRTISRSHQEINENTKDKNNESGSSSEGEDEERAKSDKQNSISTENVRESVEQTRSSEEGDDDDANSKTVPEKNIDSHKRDRVEEKHSKQSEHEIVEKARGKKEDDKKKSSDHRDKGRIVGDRDRRSQDKRRSSRDRSRSSEERDRPSRDGDRISRHRDRSGKDREDRRDREEKKSSRSDSKKHSSHHSKARKRSDDSDESDFEVKKEKDEDKRSKDHHRAEDREKTENKGSGSQRIIVNQSRRDGDDNDDSGSEQNNSA